MSNYNADSNPDLDKIRMIGFGCALFPLDTVKADQFSTLTDRKVYKFCRKIGTHRLRVQVDPAEIPGI